MSARPFRYFRQIIVTSLIVVAFALIAILVARQNRSELFQLSAVQGKAVVEALAQILKSDLASDREREERDELEVRRFTSLLWDLLDRPGGRAVITFVARQREIAQIAYLDTDSNLHFLVQPAGLDIPDIVVASSRELLRRPDTNYLVIAVSTDDITDLFSLERSNDSRRVLIIRQARESESTNSYRSAGGNLREWVARLVRDSTLLYVSWETPTQVILASESALTPDSSTRELIAEVSKGEEIVTQRRINGGDEMLELFRPFPTLTQPLGVLRVALPLNSYFAAVERADRQLVFSALLATVAVLLGSIGLAVSGRRREQEAAYDSLRGLFGNVLNSLELGVLVVDDRGVIRLSNDWLQRQLGIDCSEGREVHTFPRELVAALSSTSESEIETRDLLQSIRWLQITSVQLSLTTGEKGRLIFLHDRTRMHEAEDRLQRQARVAELGELAAGVAHDIRNPLHTISLGLQQLLQSGEKSDLGASDQMRAEIISLLREEVSRINQSVTRFLSLTRAIPVEFQSTEMRVLLEERLAAWLPRSLSEQKKLELTGVRSLVVTTEPGRIRDILDNLIRNAFEAVSPRTGEVQLQLLSQGDTWQIVIDDNGPGVSNEGRERLFSPGYTTKEGGTGIGLTLVQKGVRELGGEISVGTSPTGGARFTLIFPHESAQQSRS